MASHADQFIISWAALVKEVLQCMALSTESILLSEVVAVSQLDTCLGIPNGWQYGTLCLWNFCLFVCLDPSDGAFGHSRRPGSPLAVATP